MVTYNILSFTVLGITYLIYLFFLQKEKSFKFNRFFLLGGLILGLLLPSLQIDYGLRLSQDLPEFTTTFKTKEDKIINDFGKTEVLLENIENKESTSKNFPKYLWIYGTICLVFLFRFFWNLIKIIRKTHQNIWTRKSGMKLIVDKDENTPFSFFNYLFIRPKTIEDKKSFDNIILHESIHSKQFHSIDLLISEFLFCFFWFNPMVWIYKKNIALNHEFLADQGVLKSSKQSSIDYITLLIHHKKNNFSNPLSSGFGFNLTKKRIQMMFRKQKKKSIYILKSSFSLFALLIVMGLSSFSSDSILPQDPFVVMIDPGHGGKDPGSTKNNLIEKEFALQLSHKIAELSGSQNVIIKLTREEDEFLPLSVRAEMTKNHPVDFMLSIHTDMHNKDQKNGAMFYYNAKSKFNEKSELYAQKLSENYRKNKSPLITPREKNGDIGNADFLLLKESDVPASIFTAGFLSNSQDAEKLSDDVYQRKLAKVIYKGLVEVSKIKKN